MRGAFLAHDNASPYGAHDMADNIYEWIEDYCRESYDAGPATNPQGPKQGSGRVIRGSAFLYETFMLRGAYRGAYYPSFKGAYLDIGYVREAPTRDRFDQEMASD